MSAAPDPAELAPSRDPAAYGKRPLLTGGFIGWAVLCLVCAAGGVAFGRFGLPAATPDRPAAIAGDDQASRPTPNTAPPLPSTPPTTAPAAGAPAGADAGLADRVGKLETSASHADAAAVGALAASSLSVAADGSAPFDQEVVAYERLAPDDPDLRALQPLAARGAPSRAALAAALPDIAAAAVVAVREPAQGAGYFARLWALFGKVVIVRRVDPNAPGVDGMLTRAQELASAGDTAAAAQTLRALPPAARGVVGDWLAAADRRVEIDRRIAAIRARALASLAAPPAARS